MKKINYSDIDFSRLDRFGMSGLSRNHFYLNERDLIYKIFECRDVEKLQRREEVIDAFDELNKDYVVTATKKIVDNDTLVGYESKYIDGETLVNLMRKKGVLQLMKTILEASRQLEDLHNSDGNPIVGDLHFSNIVVDSSGKPYYIDHDSFGIKDIKPECISGVLYDYIARKDYPVEYSQNMDRLAFLLTFFHKTFGRNFLELRSFYYNDYLFMYPFLKDLKELYDDVSKKHNEIPEVPYLHKVLKDY